MRIVSWNCNLTLQRKLTALLALDPTVAIIQECERDLQVPDGYTYHWRGVNPKKGLGVLTRDEAAHVAPEASDQWAFFLPVVLPTFNLKTSIDREQSRLKSGRLLFLGRHEESPDG